MGYWHLMTMATCVMFPPHPLVCKYLTVHLRRHALDGETEIGRYARFCLLNLRKTKAKGVRHYSPSFKEIDFVTKR